MVARLGRVLWALLLAAAVTLALDAGVLAQASGTPTPAATWQLENVSVTPAQPAVGDVATAEFNVVDGQGAPVSGLRVVATLSAPAASYGQASQPILTSVGRALSRSGAYTVSVALNQPGNWWINLSASDSAGHSATSSQFVDVAPTLGTPSASTDSPVFLQGDSWGAYYRLDPATGSLATLSGQDVLHAGTRWWLAATHLNPVGDIDPQYGGTWHLSVDLSDGLTGKLVHTIDLGDIRASVYVGSTDQPAVSTALALSPDGSRLYLYWARQLGQGWLAHLAVVQLDSGKIVTQRELIGSISADVFWGSLSLSQDGTQLILAEQAVTTTSGTPSSGYRLSVFNADTLATITEHRRTVAPNDPLAACILPYPGPTGAIAGDASLRYSLCSPSGQPGDNTLVTWNPLTDQLVHQVDLSTLAGSSPLSVDGIAAPDGRHFYAVNTATQQIAEIDMVSGTVMRQTSYLSQQNSSPSTWDRLRNWLFGLVAPHAAASVLLQPGVSIAPDGKQLYLVSPTAGSDGNTGDGVLVIDTGSLQVSNHLLAGQSVSGVMVAPNGRLIVHELGDSSTDELAILSPGGQPLVSLELPDSGARAGQTR